MLKGPRAPTPPAPSEAAAVRLRQGPGQGGRLALAGAAWLLGVGWQLQLPALWPPSVHLALLLASVAGGLAALCWRWARWAPVLVTTSLMLALGSTGWRAEQRLAERLPAALEGQDLLVTGVVATMPQRGPSGLRFVFEPEAAMLRGILQVFAQYERAVIKARTASAMKVKKAKGERAGRFAPYGFADDGTGKLIPVPDEQAAVHLARELRSQGMPLRTIAAHLEAQGHQSRGKGWDPKTVSRMVA